MTGDPADAPVMGDQGCINEIDISELKTLSKLGEGAFATVEKCSYTPRGWGGDSMLVAVKKLKQGIVSREEDLISFMAEINLMRKLDHRHIVKYIGVGFSEKNADTPEARLRSMFLVLELMPGRNLKRLVMLQMATPYSSLYRPRDALRWSFQAASAIAYLHDNKIIHRDLKLENILLSGTERSTQNAMLSDFGLIAFSCHRGKGSAPALNTRTGTFTYMAPEVYKCEEYNEKVDVFSFAIIMYELFHRSLIAFEVTNGNHMNGTQQYAERVSLGYRPAININLIPELKSLIEDAWQRDSSLRPTMQEVCDRLREMRDLDALDHNGDSNRACGCLVS